MIALKKEREYKNIGILGGMGPMATVELFKSIIDHTPAEQDQNHIPIFINNTPQVPDRTEAILHDGEDPRPILCESAKKLENVGSDFVVMPCNTAHYFIEDIQGAVEIPVLNMVESTMEEISSGSKIGLLATSGTINTGVYQKYSKNKINLITPDDKYKDIFMKIIYGDRGVKAGYYGEELTNKMLEIVDHLKDKGVEEIIAGCTEVRLVLSKSDLEETLLITPIDIIAKKAVKLASR